MRDDALARLEPVEAVERKGRRRHVGTAQEVRIAVEQHLAELVEHVDLREVMALADIEVVEVMGRRDLDRAGSLLGIGILIRHDRDEAADQRQRDILADEVLVAFIFWVDGNAGVAQHRLGPRGGDDDDLVRAFDRISECQRWPLISFCTTSRSEIAVRSFGSQLTSRLSL